MVTPREVQTVMTVYDCSALEAIAWLNSTEPFFVFSNGQVYVQWHSI